MDETASHCSNQALKQGQPLQHPPPLPSSTPAPPSHPPSDMPTLQQGPSLRKVTPFPSSNPQEGPKIWLNTLIYDKRDNKPSNTLTLPALFQIDPTRFSLRTLPAEAAILTTYGFDLDLFAPLLAARLPLFLFHTLQEHPEGKIHPPSQQHPTLTFLSPPKKPTTYGVFHPKLWLIKFKDFIRVVVCTANNHFQDWALWQNAFWFQDFKLKSTEPIAPSQKFNFGQDFLSTLTLMIEEMSPKGYDVLKEAKIVLSEYDFSCAEGILIPSIPGAFTESSKYGLGKVRRVLQSLNVQTERLCYGSTSLGVLDEKLVVEVGKAFGGAHSVSLVYPTSAYIREETCGEAQVLFLSEKNYKLMRRDLFHCYQPTIPGSIPHLKTIVAEGPHSCVLYIGSHNFTKAAWGTFHNNTLKVNNYQLGILFPHYPKNNLTWLPYAYPPRKYAPEEQPYFNK